MKVILKADVKELGKKGKLCEVSDGYARNFLIPRGLAMEATEGNIQDLAHKQKQEQQRKQKEKQDAVNLAERLKASELVLKVKVGENGRLFGSVTNKEIAEALDQEYQLKIDKRKIEMKEPIKAVGEHHVTVKLHPEVTGDLKIDIVAL